MRTIKFKTLLLFLVLVTACVSIKDVVGVNGKRACGTMNEYKTRIANEVNFARNESNLEAQISKYIRNVNQGGIANFRSQVVTIPVVVHVVYNTATENISDTQINSQIAALNRDFRRNNADISTVPSAFSGLIADTKIEFVLAERDPNCNPTTGITRTSTTETSFGFNPAAGTATARNPVKFNSSNGKDAWDSSQYLNIWVCNLSPYLGYAAFPSDLASRPLEDGVVIGYQFFGDTGTASAPFDMGRTAVHEVGHWLNLRHIWGDDQFDADVCALSDFVADTPNQGNENYGCPTFPEVSCSNGPDGDMFMNYMDYVDDACMTMFSLGQSERMDAVIYTTRASIASSQGAVPPPAIAGADVFSKDTAVDVGNEPNNESTRFYRSQDIWVRNSNDGFTNEEHQNPIGNTTNFVYVKVRNRGCSASSSANTKLYWAKSNTGLSWPLPWDGSVGSPVHGSPIGTQATGVIQGSDYVILEYAWTTPNPSDYIGYGSETHFCLLARTETSSSSPFGMTFPETTNLGDNVKNNNNIVWKNVTVTIPSGGSRLASVLVTNYRQNADGFILKFKIPKQKNLLRYGDLIIDSKSPLIKYLESTNQLNTKGLEKVNQGYLVTRDGAQINDFKLEKNKPLAIYMQYFPNKEKLKFNRDIFELELEQYQKQAFIGGQNFIFKVER